MCNKVNRGVTIGGDIRVHIELSKEHKQPKRSNRFQTTKKRGSIYQRSVVV